MRTNDPQTPLLALLRALSPEQREAMARAADTSVSYLYSLGTCQRGACRSDLAKRIADASAELHKKNKDIPVVTMDALATMCAAPQAK